MSWDVWYATVLDARRRADAVARMEAMLASFGGLFSVQPSTSESWNAMSAENVSRVVKVGRR